MRQTLFAAALLGSTLACSGSATTEADTAALPDGWSTVAVNSAATETRLLAELRGEAPPVSDWLATASLFNPEGSAELEPDPARTIWLSREIPPAALRAPDPALFIPVADQTLEVWFRADDRTPARSIYRYASAGIQDDAHNAPVRFAGYPWHLVTLPQLTAAGDGPARVYLRIRSAHINIGIAGTPLLGSRAQIQLELVRDDIGRVLVAAVQVFAAIMLLGLFIWNSSQRLFLAFSMAFLSCGIYVFSRTLFKQLLWDAPLFWTYIELTGFYTLPIGIYLFFDFLLGPGRLQWIRRGWQVQIGFCVLALIAIVSGLVTLLETLLPGQLLFLVCLISVTVQAGFAAYGGNKDARIAAAGMALATLTGIYDTSTAIGLFGGEQADATTLGHYGSLLFMLSLIFIQIRKIAVTSQMLDRTGKYLSRVIHDLDSTIAQRTTDLEESRDEIARISEVARNINATTDIDAILDQVFAYFRTEFNIEAVILQLVDKQEQELYSFKTTAPDQATPEMIEYSRQLRVPLNAENGGILHRCVERKRPFYLANVDERSFPPGTDRDIIDNLGLRSFLVVPLLIQNEVVAVALFTSYNYRLKLSRDDINRVSRFCDQIAGAIHHSNLLRAVEAEREKSDSLLLNILPRAIADELRQYGNVEPMFYESVSILFTDIKGFTRVAEHMAPQELVHELDQLFEQFDLICQNYGIEKLKTIGDAYMCAGGLPATNRTHPVDIVLAALEIQAFMKQTGELIRQTSGEDFFELRVGIHNGPAMAGIIGKHKFAYDVWGDAVNVASRMESNGVAGRVNISQDTYDAVKYFFDCEARGKIELKNRGEMDMYFVNGIRPALARDSDGTRPGHVPNEKFQKLYAQLESGRKIRFRSEINE